VIVVSMIVKDSLTRVGEEVFKKVLDSTLQIPYESFVLVSDGSDGTEGFVKGWCGEHGKELVVTRSNLYGHGRPTRATARQTAVDLFLSNFSDEWLMFVDDDAVLNEGWWSWVAENRALEDPQVGEVWGINWDATPERKNFLALFGVKLEDYLVRKFHERGGCHDTLYRRKAIEGIMIPPELHVYEDAYLHHYVVRRGWKSVINPVGVTHYHPVPTLTLREEKEKAKLAIYVALKYGICEYEYVKPIRQTLRSRALAYLSLLRPVLGLAPMMLTTVRVFGLRKGIAEAFKRQYLKLWFRWQVLKAVKGMRAGSMSEMPDLAHSCAHEVMK
jgi:cellulose synthase/poly-beta-1,6-N-acetylglucosamine synthase-like glycosyltransferase